MLLPVASLHGRKFPEKLQPGAADPVTLRLPAEGEMRKTGVDNGMTGSDIDSPYEY
jgi:hypothetical protein